jgi:hypothetical protein
VIALVLLVPLLVLGLLGLGVYLLFFRSDPSQEAGEPRPAATAPGSPGSSRAKHPGTADELESTAGEYVAAVNDRDQAAATALTCERADPGTLFSVAEGKQVRLVRVEVLDGRAVGAARIRVDDGETELLLENQEDGWCVAI